MMSAPARRATLPSLRLATLLVAFGALASCSDSSGPKIVSSVAKMHLVFSSGATLDVTTNKEEPRTVHIPTAVPVTITATFFRADGTADPTVVSGAFKMIAPVTVFGSVGAGAQPITYTPSTTDAFSGVLVAPVPTVANGNGSLGGGLGFQLVNVNSGVTEFGPWTVTIISP